MMSRDTAPSRSEDLLSRWGKPLFAAMIIGFFVGWLAPSIGENHAGPAREGAGWTISTVTGTVNNPAWCADNPVTCPPRPTKDEVLQGEQIRATGQAAGVVGWLVAFGSAVALLFMWLANRRPSVRCPFCREHVRFDAVVCKHCGRDLPSP